MHDTRTVRCAVNPEIGREAEAMAVKPAVPSRTVLVAGGGPGGMEAAIVAAKRGHKVTLCESADHLGSTLDFAGGIDFKNKIDKFSACLARRVENLPIDLRLNTPVTPELVKAEDPDVLIIAVGAEAMKPPIPGLNDENVLWGTHLDHEAILKAESAIVIGGGLIGCETALFLAQHGVKASIIEMRDEVAPDCNFMHRIALLEELEKAGVELLTSMRCTKIEHGAVYAADTEGAEHCFKADELISAMGMTPRSATVADLAGLVTETHIIGDCAKSGKILNAVRNGYDAAMSIK
jgi:pyruvate/2-oxoglutarate dehydrogenase complex dihydrolipoamide dehydrogenase (E3) component